MPRPGRRRQVDRTRWRQFHSVAENFAQAAEIAAEFKYWNAAGVLLVHAAIALTDALTVKIGGAKSSGEIYHQEDIRRMTRHLERYRAWADQLLAV